MCCKTSVFPGWVETLYLVSLVWCVNVPCSVRDLQNWKRVVQQVVEKDRAVLQNWKVCAPSTHSSLGLCTSSLSHPSPLPSSSPIPLPLPLPSLLHQERSCGLTEYQPRGVGILCTVDIHDNIALVGWVRPVPVTRSLHHAGRHVMMVMWVIPIRSSHCLCYCS